MSLFDTGIRPAVDDWLDKKAEEKRDYKQYWSASSAGYCMRKVIFERLGVPPKADARKQRVFSVGDIFHKWMQDITKEAGLSIAQELELQDEELMIRGHIDDLVVVGGEKEMITGLKTEKHLILYDYKTQNSRAFSYKRDAMSHYHKMQLGTYMYMLRKDSRDTIKKLEGIELDVLPLCANLTEARILKISKDDLRMTEEQLLWSSKLEKEIVGYWSTLNGYWKAKTIPACTCADYENGFMAKEAYNPYWFDGEPCSLVVLAKWKKEKQDDTANKPVSVA